MIHYARQSPQATKGTDGVIPTSTNGSIILLIIFVCFAALANYIPLGAAVIALPFFYSKARRQAITVGLLFAFIFAIKILLGVSIPTSFSYNFFPFSLSSGLREGFTVLLNLEMFVLGRYIFPTQILVRQSYKLLFSFIIMNISIHGIVHKNLFYSTPDSTQLFAFFSMYLIVAKSKSWPSLALVTLLSIIMVAALSSSFTAIGTIVILICSLFRLLGISGLRVMWRPAVAMLVPVLMVSSLFAYAINLRASGNNGQDRAKLAQVAYATFAKSPWIGTPLGRPIVPREAIDLLGWDQYLSQGSEYNIYALSFHNSFLYLLTRYGVLSLLIIGTMILLVPSRGPLSAALFSVVPLVFMSANVVIESVRSGPALGFVLGSLFAPAFASVRTRANSNKYLEEQIHTKVDN